MRKICLVLMAVAVCVCSCTKSHIDGGEGIDVGAADSVRVNFRFVHCVDSVAGGSTKSVVALDESVINDVNLFIVNEAGGVVDCGYINNVNNASSLDCSRDVLVQPSRLYKVYIILNWGAPIVVNSEQQIKDMKYALSSINDIAAGGGGIIYSGVTESIKLYDGVTVETPVRRIVSKVSLVCDFSGLGSGVELKVKSVSLKNVPGDILLFGNNVAGSVINGEMRDSEQLLSGLSTTGVSFYTLENLQGAVSGATTNKQKGILLGDRRNVATYIEVVCDIVTREKRGEIKYKFYLGESNSNANIYRNTTQKVKVQFIGKASVDENSVSVDNSSLEDRVVSIYIDPVAIQYRGPYYGTYRCKATAYPESAPDKRLIWESDRPDLASVDEYGIITFLGNGDATICVRSADNPNILAYCVLTITLKRTG